MATKIFTFFTALVFLLFGIAGLFDSLVFLPPERIRFYDMHMIGNWGFLFGWLPVNMVHNVLYIAMGAGGLLAAPLFKTATLWSKAIFAATLMMALTGLLPFGIAQLWGLLPLFGWNVMLHVVIAILAYYFGFVYELDFGGVRPATTG